MKADEARQAATAVMVAKEQAAQAEQRRLEAACDKACVQARNEVQSYLDQQVYPAIKAATATGQSDTSAVLLHHVQTAVEKAFALELGDRVVEKLLADGFNAYIFKHHFNDDQGSIDRYANVLVQVNWE